MADLGVGPAELGQISSAWFITFAVMQFPVGWALDRVGPRRTVTACMAVGAVGAFLFSQSAGAVSASLAMALIGVGCSPVFMAALYLFARANDPTKFAGVASLFIGLGSLGNLFGAAPLARAADAFGWRPTMTVIACVFLFAGVIAALLLRDPPAPAQTDNANGGLIDGLKAVVSIRAFWFLAPITFVGYACLVTTRGLWVAPFLAEVTAAERALQGNGAFVMAVAMTAGAFAFGWAEKRMGGPKPTVLWSTLALSALYGVLALSGHAGAMWAVILFALIGLIGFNYAILMAHARLFFPEHLIGRGMTTMNFLFIAGAAAVQVGSGWLIAAERAAGMSPAATFMTLHLIFAALLAASVAVYAFSPRRPA